MAKQRQNKMTTNTLIAATSGVFLGSPAVALYRESLLSEFEFQVLPLF